VYVREKKKSGGHKELITGIQNNPYFQEGMKGIAIGNKIYESDEGTQHVIKTLEEAGFHGVSFHEMSRSNQLSEFQSDTLRKLERPLGVWDSKFMPKEEEGITVEELSNFAHSARISAKVLESKYNLYVPNAACILFYDQPQAKKNLEKDGMDMISLITLPELLLAARRFGTHYGKLIKNYRSYLADPIEWNQERGIERKKRGGTL
jgi:hypothetical protein